MTARITDLESGIILSSRGVAKLSRIRKTQGQLWERVAAADAKYTGPATERTARAATRVRLTGQVHSPHSINHGPRIADAALGFVYDAEHNAYEVRRNTSGVIRAGVRVK